VLIIFAVAIAVLGALVMVWYGRRRGGAPTELSGDWWPEFEREFRAYVARRTFHNHTINRKE
jgi:hypothetical protein